VTEQGKEIVKKEEIPGTIEFAKKHASLGRVELVEFALGFIPELTMDEGSLILAEAFRNRAQGDLEEAKAFKELSLIETAPMRKGLVSQKAEELEAKAKREFDEVKRLENVFSS